LSPLPLPLPNWFALMKKPTRYNTILTLLLGAICLSAFTFLEATQKPNIIVILADDLGWNELGCYGQKKIRTPNLDTLASEGQRWTQFYSGAPTCAPSRNVLLTGRHTGGVSVQDLKRADPTETLEDLRGDWPMAADTYTLHRALAGSGYKTAAFGKWGMGDYGTSGAPDRHAVDYFYGYTDHRMCHTFYPPYLWKNGVKQALNVPGVLGHARQPEGEVRAETYRGQKHASEAVLEEALGFVGAAANSSQPFFMYYCPLEPHVAMQPPQKWVDSYPTEWDSAPYRGERGYLPHPRPRAAYAATISFLDDHVGQLMRKLKETGADKNTLLIFTSDNGTTHDAGGVDHGFFDSVASLRGLKGQLHEGGIRVPTLVWWPGKVKASQVVEQPGYSADLMPTLCALTGADPGKPFGENLLPVILGEKPALDSRKPMIWTGGAYGGQVAVRMGNLKALRRQLFKGAKGGPLNWEVYDLAKDLEEKNDLSAARVEVIEAAKAILKKEYTHSEAFRELALFDPESAPPRQ
jgi:arylsulfatase A